MAKTVERIKSDCPVGIYRSLKACEVYVGEKRQYIPMGKVVKLGKGEANKHFEAVQIDQKTPSTEKTASILNALDRLDANNPAHWTVKVKNKPQLPKMSVIQAMVGDLAVTRKEVDVARPGFCKETLEISEAGKPEDDKESFGQGSTERNKNHQEI